MSTARTRLLLVEDDRIDQMAFTRLAQSHDWPYDWTIASSVAEATELLRGQRFDVVVSDFLLGDGSAFDLFPLYGDTPVIITTGSGNEEVAVAAMKRGASDYLIKDPNRNYLKVLPLTVDISLERVRSRQRVQQLVADLERSRAQLTQHNEQLIRLCTLVAADLQTPLRDLQALAGDAAAPPALGAPVMHLGRVLRTLSLLPHGDAPAAAPTTFELADAARDALAQLQREGLLRDVRLSSATATPVHAPRQQVTDLLAVLVAAAIGGATRMGPLALELGAHPQGAPEQGVSFLLRCAGQDLPATPDGGTAGTGVSIALAQEIVQRHDGRLRALPSSDGAVAFEVTLAAPPAAH